MGKQETITFPLHLGCEEQAVDGRKDSNRKAERSTPVIPRMTLNNKCKKKKTKPLALNTNVVMVVMVLLLLQHSEEG